MCKNAIWVPFYHCPPSLLPATFIVISYVNPFSPSPPSSYSRTSPHPPNPYHQTRSLSSPIPAATRPFWPAETGSFPS